MDRPEKPSLADVRHAGVARMGTGGAMLDVGSGDHRCGAARDNNAGEARLMIDALAYIR